MHNCEDVLIENCFIRTFDDSICVKGFDCYYEGDVEEAVKKAMYRNGKAYDVFKNTVIKNCTIWNDWGKCLEIGAETRAEEICDIVFENSNIIHAIANPLDCYNVDYADVHDVIYRDINVEFDDIMPEPLIQKNDNDTYKITNPDFTPNLICVLVECHHEYSAGGERRGINRDIIFENIRLYSRQKPTMYFEGYDEKHKTKNILIKNFFWNDMLLESFDAVDLKLGKFVDNIRLEFTEKQ